MTNHLTRDQKIVIHSKPYIILYIDGLVQERRKSSALAMELRLFCTSRLIFPSLDIMCVVFTKNISIWIAAWLFMSWAISDWTAHIYSDTLIYQLPQWNASGKDEMGIWFLQVTCADMTCIKRNIIDCKNAILDTFVTSQPTEISY